MRLLLRLPGKNITRTSGRLDNRAQLGIPMRQHERVRHRRPGLPRVMELHVASHVVPRQRECIEHHQTLDRASHRCRSAKPVVRLAVRTTQLWRAWWSRPVPRRQGCAAAKSCRASRAKNSRLSRPKIAPAKTVYWRGTHSSTRSMIVVGSAWRPDCDDCGSLFDSRCRRADCARAPSGHSRSNRRSGNAPGPSLSAGCARQPTRELVMRREIRVLIRKPRDRRWFCHRHKLGAYLEHS
jgi:hypothetical protein